MLDKNTIIEQFFLNHHFEKIGGHWIFKQAPNVKVRQHRINFWVQKLDSEQQIINKLQGELGRIIKRTEDELAKIFEGTV